MANDIVQFDIETRKIDFVTQFETDFRALEDLLSVSRPIVKQSGADLYMKKVTIDLADQVAKGETIELTDADIEGVKIGPITIEKYRKKTTIEDISEYGFDNAVERTDEALRRSIGGRITTNLYTTLVETEGATTGTESDIQMAMAMALADVDTFFDTTNLGMTGSVAFVNTKDFYKYLGGKDISLQQAFGLRYVQDFMDYDVVFVNPRIPEGTVVATALNNLNVYAINPSDSDFAKAGLSYTTDGDTGVIGVAIEGDYKTASSETYAICGVMLVPEYIGGVSVYTITP